MFEHANSRKFSVEKFCERAQSAKQGECSMQLSLDQIKSAKQNKEYIAVIPFYGGLQPYRNNTESLGEGNSMVGAATKGLQCMAAVC